MRISMAVCLGMMLAVCACCRLPVCAQDAEPFIVSAPIPFAVKPELTVMPGHRAAVKLAAVSADGKYLATSGAGDTVVLLWDLPACRLLRTLEGQQKEITALAFSSDGGHVAAGTTDGTILQWNTADGKIEQTMARHAERINVLAYSPNSRWLASGSDDKTVTLWDAPTGSVAQVMAEHTAGVSALAFSPDNALLASGGLDRHLALWNLTDGLPGVGLSDAKNPVAVLAFNPAGTTLAVASGPNLGGAERRFAACEVTQLTLATGLADKTLTGIGAGYPTIAYSPDGTQLVTASSDKTLLCWDADTGLEQQVTVGQLPLPGLQRSLTWERDGILKLWAIPDSRLLMQFVGLDAGAAWLRATPQGYYDGSVGADAFAAWRFGAVVPIPCDRFANGFNKPQLVARALAGGDLSQEPVLDGQVLPPNIAIISPKGDREMTDQLIDVKVQAAGMKPLTRLDLTLSGKPIPLELVKTITEDTPDRTRDTFRLQLRLPISNTAFRLRAVVTDAGNMTSAPAEVMLFAPGAQPFADKLHVLCVGVGQYRTDGIPPLRYAAADAQAIAGGVRRRPQPRLHQRALADADQRTGYCRCRAGCPARIAR